ncbi:MAG: hypothetical protein LBC49_01990, partial [Bacteroidales bacterium]|nr:hypothetical protein [Bacteroidales bacterium]
MKKIFSAFLIFGCVVYAASENLPIKGKQAGSEIFLRWAVTDVGIWRKAQQRGFLVERFSMEKVLWNGQVRNDFVRDKSWTVQPHSINDTAAWLALENDDAVMLTAQTLVQGVDMHNDTLSYIMAMLACDRSFTAARMAGFGLKDTLPSGTNPLEMQKYFYRISLQGTEIFGEWK